MNPLNVKLKLLYNDSVVPKIIAPGARSFDLHASLNRPERIVPGGVRAVPTGIAMEVPEGYGLYIGSRAGLAKRHEIYVLNSTGLIECDYPGEIYVILKNGGSEPFYINPAAKIAHAWIAPVTQVGFEVTE